MTSRGKVQMTLGPPGFPVQALHLVGQHGAAHGSPSGITTSNGYPLI